MTLRKTRSLVLLFAAFAFALAACGGTAAVSFDDEVEDHVEADTAHDDAEDHVESEADHDEAEEGHDEEAGHDAEEFSFGSPADASDADRVIEVDANDNFTFGPADLVVSEGETITFV
ncbi:MAG: hypothetical protein V3S32_05580, partial [Acidimicrobiia bacterium]